MINDDQMLMLFFESGDKKFAIECKDVVEVIPNLKTNDCIQYHGMEIPVADFSALQDGQPAQSLLSTRIILINTGDNSITGFSAEKVLHTEKIPLSSFIKSGSSNGLSDRQIVTENANVPVLDPTLLISAIKKTATTGK